MQCAPFHGIFACIIGTQKPSYVQLLYISTHHQYLYLYTFIYLVIFIFHNWILISSINSTHIHYQTSFETSYLSLDNKFLSRVIYKKFKVFTKCPCPYLMLVLYNLFGHVHFWINYSRQNRTRCFLNIYINLYKFL